MNMQQFKERLAEEYGCFVDIDEDDGVALKYLYDKYKKLIGKNCIIRDHENNKILVNTKGVRTNQPKPAKVCGVTHNFVILKYKTYSQVECEGSVVTKVSILTTTVSFAALHCGAVDLELLSS